MHRQLALTAALQAFEAIQLRDAVYVACPVSSGRRELDMMIALSLFDRDTLRSRHADEWRRQVLEPNKTEAARSVNSARVRHTNRTVINPATFELSGLTQPDYDALCGKIIEAHVGHLVLADGWQYSRGARIEAVQAIGQGLTVEDAEGNPLRADDILSRIEDVVPSLVGRGFAEDVARALMPDAARDAPAVTFAHS